MKNAILTTTLFAWTLIGCTTKSETPAPSPSILPVYNVQSTNANTDSEFPASIQGTVDVEIRPQVSGKLERVYVDEGTYVTKGQLLFKINEQPFREQLNNALASLHSAEAALMNAQLEIDKLTPLVQNKVVSDYQMKTAKTSHKIASANLDQAKAIVASAKINLNYSTSKRLHWKTSKETRKLGFGNRHRTFDKTF